MTDTTNQPTLAIADPNTAFSHVAVYWDEYAGVWSLLCAGRTLEEFNERVQYWIGRGHSAENIRMYECAAVALPIKIPADADQVLHHAVENMAQQLTRYSAGKRQAYMKGLLRQFPKIAAYVQHRVDELND